MYAQFPDRWSALHQLGWLHSKLGKNEKAIDLYQETIRKCLWNAWECSALDLLEIYRNSWNVEAGFNYFDGLVNEGTCNNWSIWHAYAWLRWNYRPDGWKEEVIGEEVLQAYRKSLALHPDGGWGWTYYDLGYVLGDLKRYDEAYEELTSAKARQPHWSILRRMAWTKEMIASSSSHRSKEFNDALEHNKEVLRLFTEDPGAWVGLGIAYQHRPKSSVIPENRQLDYILAWEALLQVISKFPSLPDELREQVQSELALLQQEPRIQLHKLLSERLDSEELDTLCMYAGLSSGELGTGGIRHSTRVMNFMLYFQDREQELKRVCPKLCVNTIW